MSDVFLAARSRGAQPCRKARSGSDQIPSHGPGPSLAQTTAVTCDYLFLLPCVALTCEVPAGATSRRLRRRSRGRRTPSASRSNRQQPLRLDPRTRALIYRDKDASVVPFLHAERRKPATVLVRSSKLRKSRRRYTLSPLQALGVRARQKLLVRRWGHPGITASGTFDAPIAWRTFGPCAPAPSSPPSVAVSSVPLSVAC